MMENGKKTNHFQSDSINTQKIDITENSEVSSETAKLQEQFNAQRARMKELYLQKEKECSQMKQKMILMKKEIEEKDSQLGNFFTNLIK